MTFQPPPGKHEKCTAEIARLESTLEIRNQILRLSLGINGGLFVAAFIKMLFS